MLAPYLVSALVAVQSSTSLDAGPLSIAWSAPEGCPSASAVLGRVRALFGSGLDAALKHPLDARGQVARLDSGRYSLELEIREGADLGARTIEAATCDELAQAGALVIALTIDPELLERSSAGESAGSGSEAKAPSAATSASAAPPAPAPPPRPEAERVERKASELERGALSPRLSPRLGVGARGVGDWGTLPDLGVGAELGVHVEWPAWRLELNGLWLPSRRAAIFEDRSVGGLVELMAVGARLCTRSVRDQMTGGLCAGLEVGRFSAEAFGAVENGSGSMGWVSPGAGISGEWAMSPFFGFAGRLELLVPLNGSEFIVENVGKVWEPTPVVGRVTLGVDADFW